MITKLFSSLTSCFPRASLRQQTAVGTMPDRHRARSVLPMDCVSNQGSYRPFDPEADHSSPAARFGNLSPVVISAGRSTMYTPGARLAAAVRAGNYELVRDLLKADIDPNVCHGKNDPPVLLAARSTHRSAPDILALLLQAGANPNTASAVDRTTPLIYAIRQGSVGMVKVLLSQPGINIHQADASGQSAYQYPIRMISADARAEISELLGAHRYNSSHEAADEWISAAMLGGVDDRSTLKRLYATYGSAIVDAIGYTSRTALWEAANHGHVDVVEQLLDWGADPAFHSGDGNTAVDQARRSNADDIVAAFEAHAASEVAPAAHLCRAVMSDNLTEVEGALNVGVLTDARHRSNDFPLLIALRSTHRNADAIAQLLLTRGADPNSAARDDGATPLIIAIREKKVDVISHLLAHRDIRFDQADNSGKSAYDHALAGWDDEKGFQIYEMLKHHVRAHAPLTAGM